MSVDLGGVLRPVREGNAFEETVERLLTVIKLGLIGPGERFPPERELAAQLGHQPADAARGDQGAAAGRLRASPGAAGWAARSSPTPGQHRTCATCAGLAQERGQKLADALTFRFAVETGAADMLAQQVAAAVDPAVEPAAPVARIAAADGSLASRREVLQARLADVNDAGPADYRRMDTLFHLAIAELTGSNLLSTACAEARMQLNDLLNAIPMLKLNIAHAATQHAAIVDAILAGDPERARTAVAEHLAGTGSLLRGFLG